MPDLSPDKLSPVQLTQIAIWFFRKSGSLEHLGTTQSERDYLAKIEAITRQTNAITINQAHAWLTMAERLERLELALSKLEAKLEDAEPLAL